MPCLSGRYNPAVGVLIQGVVAPSGAMSGPMPLPKAASVVALVDTGAGGTCISPAVAQALGLVPMGMRPMVSATQQVPVNSYLVDLALVFGPQSFTVPSHLVLEFPMGGVNAPFQVLLGRDLLCKGVFTMGFDGHFSFSL